MKKKIAFLTICVLCIAMLAGCCLSHDWVDATCTTAKTCSKCDKVEGEPLGHSWSDATCESAATCSYCGETKGQPLGHTYGDWAIAGNMMERSCSTCNNVESTDIDRELMLGILLEGKWEGYQIIHNGQAYNPIDGDYAKFTRDGGFEQQFNNNVSTGSWTFGEYMVTDKGTSAYWGNISMNGKNFSFILYDDFSDSHPYLFCLIVGDYVMGYIPA